MDLSSTEILKLSPLALVAVSVLGSPHCVGMCGPLVLPILRSSWHSVVQYHVGRIGAYILLGSIAGGIGKAVFETTSSPWITWGSLVCVVGLLLGLSIQSFRGRSFHPKLFGKLWSVLASRTLKRWRLPFFLGALSALLPCGWLYAFVLAAAASGSSSTGAGVLFFFGLGTVPALSLLKAGRPLFEKIPRDFQSKWVGVMLAGCAALVLVQRWPSDSKGSGASRHCHCSKKSAD